MLSKPEDSSVSEISVSPKQGGTVAVYLVEAVDEEETRTVCRMFEELTPEVNVVRLSRGRLVSYAVQTASSDISTLDDLEAALRNHYRFVLVQRSFDAIIYRVVKELCAHTGSRLLSIPRCNICGKPEPFPETVVTLADDSGSTVMNRFYCGTCTSSLLARTNKGFVRSLLSADKHDFAYIAGSELIRSRARRHCLKYKIRSSVGSR